MRVRSATVAMALTASVLAVVGERERRSRFPRVVAAAALVVAMLLAGCAGDNEAAPGATSGSALDQQVSDLDALLRRSIAELGLDPSTGRKRVVDNSCVGSGGRSKNVRYYYDEDSYDRGVGYLRELEDYWGHADGFEINVPLQDDGFVASLLAVSGDLSLEAWQFPASNELVIGGSTPCND